VAGHFGELRVSGARAERTDAGLMINKRDKNTRGAEQGERASVPEPNDLHQEKIFREHNQSQLTKNI
jgi:hypothetical protein